MASGQSESHEKTGDRTRHQGTHGGDEISPRQGLLVGERAFPGCHFIDPSRFFGGEFLGYFLGVPYDWNVSDPDLMDLEGGSWT